jgi:hypothetical protein
MPSVRTTNLPALTTPLEVETPDLTDGETAYTIVSAIGTPLQDYPWGSPVHVDPWLSPLPPVGGAAGPLLLGATLLPGAQLRLRWRGPSVLGTASVRVTVFPALQID